MPLTMIARALDALRDARMKLEGVDALVGKTLDAYPRGLLSMARNAVADLEEELKKEARRNDCRTM